jgi:hypothetical protein
MGVASGRFGDQGMNGCSCRRVFWSLPEEKIAKIKENVMMSLMQWWNGGDDDLMHPRGHYGCGPRRI